MPSAWALRAEGLACRRGGRRVFSGLNLQLGRGQALWLRGPNGCGKTSLLRLLAGLARPDAGHVHVHAHGSTEAASARPAYISHSNALKDELTLHEALGFLCSLHRLVPSRRHLSEALGRFGLAGRLDTPVRTLSQGQRRKASLARLWLQDAAIWLLDEPYDALDDHGSAVLNEALAAHLQQGGGLILTSHQPVSLPGLLPFELALEAGR